MKKIKKIFFICIAALTVMLCNILTVPAKEQIKIKVDAGIESKYKYGNIVPFSVEIQNSLKDIQGELQIEVPNDTYNVKKINMYTKPISLSENSTKKINIPVCIMNYVNKVKVNIVQGKETVYSEEVNILPGITQGALIGILSDDYNSVNYMNTINPAGTGVNEGKVVEVTKETLPDDSDLMKMLDIIIINNFDTSSLSKKQYEALKKWTLAGGTLVVGTGSSYSKTLGIFKDDFLQGEVLGEKTITTKSLESFVSDSKAINSANSSSLMKVNVLNLNISNSSVIVKDQNIPLIQRVNKGNGCIAVAAFDFGLNPIAQWNLKEKLFTNITAKVILEKQSINYIADQSNNKIRNINSSLRSIPDLPTPNFKFILILFAVYIIIVAPLNYIVLKRKDKRELMWITVPCISLIFSIVMYNVGFTSRLTKPIVNALNYVTTDLYGNSNVESYVSLFTPNKGDLKVEAEEGMDIKPVMESDNHNYVNNNVNEDEKEIDFKVTYGSKNTLEFYKNKVFTSRLMKAQNDENYVNGIELNMKYVEGKIGGTIKNNTEYNLEDSVIVLTNNYINIGDIKKGEIKQLNKYSLSRCSLSNYYDINNMFDSMYSAFYNSNNGSVEDIKKRKVINFRRDILSNYFNNPNFSEKFQKFIAFSNLPLTKDITVNEKEIKKYETTLIMSDISLSFRNGKKVDYPLGHVQGNLASTTLQESYNNGKRTFTGTGQAEVEFQIDKDINPSKILINYLVQGEKSSTNPALKQYLWDAKENKWIKGTYDNYLISEGKMNKYVSKDNKIKIKLEIPTPEITVEFPMISVKGSVK